MSNVQVLITKKTCSACEEEKQFSEFQKNKNGKFGLQAKCRVCRSTKNKTITKQKKTIVSIPKHTLSIPKTGKPLGSYELLDNKRFQKWIELNIVSDPLAVEQAKVLREHLLGGRDYWHAREFHASQVIGAHHNPFTTGADAHLHCGRPVELKLNWSGNPTNKLYAYGTFNDYTQERLDRLYQENYMLVSALYVKHKLIAAIDVPLHWGPFQTRLQSQLNKTGRVCLAFSSSDWIGSPDVKFLVKPTLMDLIEYKDYIGASLFNHMVEHLNNDITGLTSGDIA